MASSLACGSEARSESRSAGATAAVFTGVFSRSLLSSLVMPAGLGAVSEEGFPVMARPSTGNTVSSKPLRVSRPIESMRVCSESMVWRSSDMFLPTYWLRIPPSSRRLKLLSNGISTSLSRNDSRLKGTLRSAVFCSRRFSNCSPCHRCR